MANRRVVNPFGPQPDPSPVEQALYAYATDRLRAEYERLEADCVDAMAHGDYDKLDRLMIFCVAEWGASTADHVGWVGSFVPELYRAELIEFGIDSDVEP